MEKWKQYIDVPNFIETRISQPCDPEFMVYSLMCLLFSHKFQRWPPERQSTLFMVVAFDGGGIIKNDVMPERTGSVWKIDNVYSDVESLER